MGRGASDVRTLLYGRRANGQTALDLLSTNVAAERRVKRLISGWPATKAEALNDLSRYRQLLRAEMAPSPLRDLYMAVCDRTIGLAQMDAIDELAGPEYRIDGNQVIGELLQEHQAEMRALIARLETDHETPLEQALAPTLTAAERLRFNGPLARLAGARYIELFEPGGPSVDDALALLVEERRANATDLDGEAFQMTRRLGDQLFWSAFSDMFQNNPDAKAEHGVDVFASHMAANIRMPRPMNPRLRLITKKAPSGTDQNVYHVVDQANTIEMLCGRKMPSSYSHLGKSYGQYLRGRRTKGEQYQVPVCVRCAKRANVVENGMLPQLEDNLETVFKRDGGYAVERAVARAAADNSTLSFEQLTREFEDHLRIAVARTFADRYGSKYSPTGEPVNVAFAELLRDSEPELADVLAKHEFNQEELAAMVAAFDPTLEDGHAAGMENLVEVATAAGFSRAALSR